MSRLPIPSSSQLTLLVTPHTVGSEDLFELVARLALRGPLQVVDGGNTFNAYRVALLLRRHTADAQTVLQRIELARVFTCYQMEALFQGALAGGQPVLALDYLATFCDENVPRRERWRLLRRCTARLKQISAQAPAVIWVRTRQATIADSALFLEWLRRSADKVWEMEPPLPVLGQPALF